MAGTNLPNIFAMHLQVSSNDRLIAWLSRYWIGLFGVLFGIYVGLPFLAPVFMHIGWTSLGKGIYLIYSFLCHQLPERSFFLFGPRASYSLAEIHSAGVNTSDLFLLRQFTGSPEMGWKVAWSDRMVSMFTSILLLGIVWYPLRRRIPKLPWWGFIPFLAPMAIDGTSHFISDLAGIGQGFRDSNAWLAIITRNAYPSLFYSGDALGSFNSWMRLITGVLFGLGVVWFGFPFLDEALGEPARRRQLRAELDREFLERLLNDVGNTTPQN